MASDKMKSVVSEFMAYLKSLNGKSVEMTDVGQRLRAILDRHNTKPNQIGLSKNHPAKSMLSRLKEQGKIRFNDTPGGKNRVSVEVLAPSQKKAGKTAVSKSTSPKSRAIVTCDIQNLGVPDNQVEKFDKWIRQQVEQRVPGLHTLFRAYCGSQQGAASDRLNKLGWRSKSQRLNADQAIINDAKSYCGEKPAATVLFLGTKDGGFRESVSSLKQKGVTVFLIAPEQNTNPSLIQAVGKEHWIKMPAKW